MLFNILKKWTKSLSETCPIINIRDFEPKTQLGLQKDQLSAIQMFNSPYRMSNDAMDWTFWNGCVFVDIDTKKYTGFKAATLKWDLVENALVEQLTLNYFQNFLFEQKSFSGNSFHIVFYYNCPKNSENFQKAAIFSQNIVKRIFQNLDLGDVIEYPEVLDTCGNKPCQPLFMSNYPIHIVDEKIQKQRFFGEYDFNHISISKKEIEFKNSDVKFLNNELSLKNVTKFDGISWPHENRLRLIIVLYNFFGGDIEKAWTIYQRIIPFMVMNGNEHDENTLTRLFRTQFPKVGKYNMNKSMLDFCKLTLGLSYKSNKIFEPKTVNSCKYDKEIEIDGFLSDIIQNIIKESTKNIIHIEAGCGLGKTFSADILTKNLNLNNYSTNPEYLFGNEEPKRRICFVTPMTSINRDNFDKKEFETRWKIIDNEHKDNKIFINSSYNICTTWDSFISNNLSEQNFTYFLFDEIHSLYMYDYRTRIISQIKNQIKEIAMAGKKVILFTGTPSLEIDEFNSYNVKVSKKLNPVKCNIVFYNDQYIGWLCNDIKNWLSKSPNNRIGIFHNKSNNESMERLIQRGIQVDFLFNKQFDENVEYANKKHDMDGNIGMFSVYGQAGINLYSNSPIRLYILDNNAMGIIQYANRFRNREMIESINIVYPKENITNSIVKEEEVNTLYIKELVNKVNKIYPGNKAFNQNMFLIKNSLGLVNEYLDTVNDVKILNEERYKAWAMIQNANNYEKQMQIIYNRLIKNYYIVNFVYLDEDPKDPWKSKFKGHFAGILMESTKNLGNLLKRSTKSEMFYIDENADKNLKKVLVGDVKKNLEYIFNSLYKLAVGDDIYTRIHYMEKQWKLFIENCLSRKDTITKSDIKNFCEILHIKKHFNSFDDNYILYQIIKKHNNDGNKLNDLSAMQIASTYTTLFKIDELSFEECKLFADQSFINIKKLDGLIEEYKWFINWNEVIDNGEIIEDTKLSDENMEFNQRIINYLDKKHGKRNSGKEIIYKGEKFSSITEMAGKFGISRETARKWLSKQ